MTQVETLREFYRGKRVLVTGHTGFKGAWLSEWLLHLGAEVTGYSLAPKSPALFTQLQLEKRLSHVVADIRDAVRVGVVVRQVKPDVIFHLAAQALVRESYVRPSETFEVNVNGTINILEALRTASAPCAAVAITTDKCYDNREWMYGYRESDPLGGHDPYSASKACAELAVGSYWRALLSHQVSPRVTVATARAGNVIGGGDWSEDRIVPDAMRSLWSEQPVPVRNPGATRPWQHVVEPLWGYLVLGQRLHANLGNAAGLGDLCSPFNFGPNVTSNRRVSQLVDEVLKTWPGTWKDVSAGTAPHEAGRLHLSSDKAFHQLGWRPVWGFPETVNRCVAWYAQAKSASDAPKLASFTRSQIDDYMHCVAEADGIIS